MKVLVFLLLATTALTSISPAASRGGAPLPATAPILLNEVLYDPPGADGGREFVELISRSSRTESLVELRLEFCNGATPGQWRILWEGAAGDSLAAGALMVLGESQVDAARFHMELGMQNGPEALRLCQGEEVFDLLGYGEPLDAELCETWPAPDAAGRCLARRPDGVDTDQNVLDWFVSDPTPGDWNYPAFRVKLLEASLPAPPLAPGASIRLSVVAENRGHAAWPEVLQLLVGTWGPFPMPRALPGHLSALSLYLPGLPAGDFDLDLRVARAGELSSDSLRLRGRVGLGPLLISEILFAPLSGRSEWLECLCRETLTPPAEFTLSDLSGTQARFSPPPLLPGERVLLCADRPSLLAEHPHLSADRVLELTPWPSLANAGESEAEPGWTEGLRLDDEQGRRVDGLLYRGDWIGYKGQSLERLYEFPSPGLSPWSPCPRGSTPLAGGDPGGGTGRALGLRLAPNPFDPERERLSFVLSARAEYVRLRIFDAGGRPVQRIELPAGAGRIRLYWDGRDETGALLADGVYPFLLETGSAAGIARQQRGVCGLLRGPR